MFLLYGLLAAVIERGVSGKGKVVDAAMIGGGPAMMGLIHGMIGYGEWVAGARGDNWLDGGAPFCGCYTCSDGRYIAFRALEAKFFVLVLKGLGLAEDDLPDQNDHSGWPVLKARFAAVFAGRTRDEWRGVLAGTDACVAPLLSLAEEARNPHLAERGVDIRPGGVQQASAEPRFFRSDPGGAAVPGAAGADTDSVLETLGSDATAIAALRTAGTIL